MSADQEEDLLIVKDGLSLEPTTGMIADHLDDR
jgi:hypothetical protein